MKLKFIVFMIALHSVMFSGDNTSDKNKEDYKPIVRIVNGFIALCKSVCPGDSNIAIGCTYTDDQGRSHYSHGHCPKDFYYDDPYLKYLSK